MHVQRLSMLAPMDLFTCQIFYAMSSLPTLQEDLSNVDIKSLTTATFPLLVGKEFIPTKKLHVLAASFALNVFCKENGLLFVLMKDQENVKNILHTQNQ